MAQILDLIIILFYYLGDIDLSGSMIFIASPTTIFVFLGGLALRLISKRWIVEISFVFVFVFGSLIAGLPKDVFLVFFG